MMTEPKEESRECSTQLKKFDTKNPDNSVN